MNLTHLVMFKFFAGASPAAPASIATGARAVETQIACVGAVETRFGIVGAVEFRAGVVGVAEVKK